MSFGSASRSCIPLFGRPKPGDGQHNDNLTASQVDRPQPSSVGIRIHFSPDGRTHICMDYVEVIRFHGIQQPQRVVKLSTVSFHQPPNYRLSILTLSVART